ncbi:MAG TPA: RNA-binding cell elongation regulator Jag/EloR [Chloroflexota bacterium]|nr:RNA-binding cell elongation regulator Jag/EloR [Chloroflexota bacterium]
METVEVTGKTVDDAIAAASAKLGIPADRLDYEIVSEGSKGILGIGAEDAKIVVSLEPALAPGERPPAGGYAATAAASEEAEDEEAEGEPVPAPAAARRKPRVDNAPDLAGDLLEELLERLGIDADIELRDEDPITLNVVGDDLGILIGRRGETLSAVQFILNQMLNHKTGEWLGVIVDAEDYRLRREDQLRGLARRMADRARYYRQSVTLDPMPPHERRIIHLALADSQHVSTNSVGEGEDRRVVISPK